MDFDNSIAKWPIILPPLVAHQFAIAIKGEGVTSLITSTTSHFCIIIPGVKAPATCCCIEHRYASQLAFVLIIIIITERRNRNSL